MVIGPKSTSDTLGFRLDCTASLFFALQLDPGNIFLSPKLDAFVVGEGSSELATILVAVALFIRGLLLLSAGHAGKMSFPSVRTRISGSFRWEFFGWSCCLSSADK